MITLFMPCAFNDDGFKCFLIRKFKFNVMREIKHSKHLPYDVKCMILGYISTLTSFYYKGGYLLRLSNKNLLDGLKLTRNDMSMLMFQGSCANECYRLLWDALEVTKSNLPEYVSQYKQEGYKNVCQSL